MLGRGQVQAHDVFQFLDKLWVARDLEPAHDVRLQTVGLPVPHDGARAHAQHCAHLACAPVRGRLGRALRGQFHQFLHVHLHRRRPARQVAFDPFKAKLQVALAPARDLHPAHAQCLGNVLVLQTLRGQQHDARSQRHSNTQTREHSNAQSARALSTRPPAPRSTQKPGQLAIFRSNTYRCKSLEMLNAFKFPQESNTTLARPSRQRQAPAAALGFSGAGGSCCWRCACSPLQ